MSGLVVRNTFLEVPVDDGRKLDDGGVEREAERRPRAVSDLTDMKLPWKMAMSEQAEGVYQVQRRRFGSGAGGDHGESEALQTVEEEMSQQRSKRGSRKSLGNNRRSRVDTAEFIPGTMGGMGMPGFYPPMPMGPPGGMPMMPPGYPPPWGYPGGYPPHMAAPPSWGRWPDPTLCAQGPYPGWPPYPGLVPPSPSMQGPYPGAAAQQGYGGPAPKAGKGGGKQRREPAGNASQPSEKPKNKGGAAKASTEGTSKASAPAIPEHPEHLRTTVMFRNIPDQYTSGSLLALLDEHNFQTLYNFVYLPMDFGKGVNLGYAFVNLVNHEESRRFMRTFDGFTGWRYGGKQVSEAGEVSWAHPHQGWEEHVERYRNSPVMHPSMPDEYKPMIFQDGARVTFLPPNKVIKAPKLRLGRERPREPGHDASLREGPEAVQVAA